MFEFDLTLSNHQSEAEGFRRAKAILRRLARKFPDRITDLKENWDLKTCEFNFKYMDVAISGTLFVGTSIQVLGRIECPPDCPEMAKLYVRTVASAMHMDIGALFA